MDFKKVTECGGELVSREQLDRFTQRYLWAGALSEGKDVLELACGTGPGLGFLVKVSRSLVAADISSDILSVAQAHYGERVDLRLLDACNTGLKKESFDVIILFEAIYYLYNVDVFMTEAIRLLRPGGILLIATANKNLFDFNPSPYSYYYFNPPEFCELMIRHGFDPTFFGGSPVPADGPKAQIIRFAKRFAVRYDLIPASMDGKRMLKRLVFGPLVSMPIELDPRDTDYIAPKPIPADQPDVSHQVLYCLARKI
jgi:SAM-dependent methyltransferase